MSREGGLLRSGRRLLATLIEIVQVRLELAATELELEKLRLFDALLIGLISVVVFSIGVLLLCILVVLLAGQAWRLHVLLVLAVLFVGGGAAGLWLARQRLRRPGTLLEATAAEFARDRAELLSGDLGPHR